MTSSTNETYMKTRVTNLDIDELKARLMVIGKNSSIDSLDFIKELHGLCSVLLQNDLSKSVTITVLDTTKLLLSRSIQLYKTDTVLATALHSQACHNELIQLFQILCQIYETGSGPFTNAVSGLLTKHLQLCDHILMNEERSALLGKFSHTLASLPPTQKRYFAMFEAFLKGMRGAVSSTQKLNHDLPLNCLNQMHSSDLANAASKAFAAFFYYDSSMSTTEYIDTWSVLVVQCMQDAPSRQNIIRYLLPKLFRSCSSSYLPWVRTLEFKKNQSVEIETWLSLIQAANTICASQDPLSEDVLTKEALLSFLKHSSAHVRRDAFSLLCSSPRPTRETPSYVLELISSPDILLTFFLESDTPESRSDFFSTLRRPLLHSREYIVLQEKRFLKHKDPAKKKSTTTVRNFCQRVFNFVKSQLVPDSSYPQLILSCELLKFFVEYEFDGSRRGLNYIQPCGEIVDIYSDEIVCKVLRFSTNNYEDVRIMSSSIIEMCPFEILSPFLSKQKMQNTLPLLSSLKGRQSESAKQLILTISKIYHINAEDEELLNLIDLLVEDQSDLKLDIYLPHGNLGAIEKVLSIISPMFYRKHQERMNALITQLLKFTLSVLENSTTAMEQILSNNFHRSQSSMWRMVKDSSSLLRCLLVINVDNNWRFLSKESFLAECDTLMKHLGTVSHKGALSAVYQLFAATCKICFQNDMVDTLLLWLDQNLDLVEIKQQLISRRSAGIPYLVTGILNALDGTSLQEALSVTFSKLMTIALKSYNPNANEKHDIPQVHALNIMKHIFKESSLIVSTEKYLAEAFQISLSNLDHKSWAIKNSALMLFTALQERITNSSRNGGDSTTLIASSFLRNFPEIGALLKRKIECAENTSANDVIPILSILVTLRVSLSNDVSLQPFVSLIQSKLLNHSSWIVREMSARSICSMTHPEHYSEVGFELLAQSSRSKNEFHGNVLCVLELVKASKELHIDVDEILDITELRFIEQNSNDSGDWAILRTLLLVLMEEELSDKIQIAVMSIILELQISDSKDLDGTRGLFIQTAVTALLCSSKSELDLLELSKSFLSSKKFDFQVGVVNFWSNQNHQYRELTELQTLIVSQLNEGCVSNYVCSKFLQVLKGTGAIPQSLIDPSSEWSDNMKCLNLVLWARQTEEINEFILESLIRYAADDMDEELRCLSVEAIVLCLQKESISGSVRFTLLFSLFFRLSDESSRVRELSSIPGKCPEESKNIVLSEIFGGNYVGCYGRILQYLEDYITDNIQNYELDKANQEFEVERVNHFRNEVATYFDLLDRLRKTDEKVADIRDKLSAIGARSVKKVTTVLLENQDFLDSWVYNVHLDTAIRNVLHFEEDEDGASELDFARLKKYLLDIGYY